MSRKFFVVTREHGIERLSIHHDDLPTKSMLGGKTVVYKLELLGQWRALSLDELAAEYRRRARDGTLPADNTGRRRKARAA